MIYGRRKLYLVILSLHVEVGVGIGIEKTKRNVDTHVIVTK